MVQHREGCEPIATRVSHWTPNASHVGPMNHDPLSRRNSSAKGVLFRNAQLWI